MIDAIKNSLALELVESLDGILSANGIAKRHMGSDELGEDFRAAGVSEAVLDNADFGFEVFEGFVLGSALKPLLEEGGAIYDGADGMIFSSSSSFCLGGTIDFMQCGLGPEATEAGMSHSAISLVRRASWKISEDSGSRRRCDMW